MISSDATPTTRGVGIVGTGVIFRAYARGLSQQPHLPVLRVADLDQDRARAAAAEWDVPRTGTAEDLFADPDVEIVVNITPPGAHAALTDAALRAGKHVYVEKPPAATVADAERNVATARETGLLLGGAPDTFLGTAGQTARAAIDAGLIGRPFGATSFVRSSRAETWHPEPSFLFRAGGGPVLDMGPYHVAALVNLLGPVARVVSASSRPEQQLLVTAADKRVDRVDVEIDTHSTSILQFASGALATAVYSFDVWDTELPQIEVYGTEGTLAVPDPNHYDQPVRIRRRGEQEWRELPPALARVTPDDSGPFRGPGVVDLAAALDGAPHRTSAEFALHVLHVLAAVQEGSLDDGVVDIASRPERPAPLVEAAPTS